ncbi:c-type cytochrome [Aequorivita ciconiae]|nr:cytochrome c [Aequorivita sp. H23M31]
MKTLLNIALLIAVSVSLTSCFNKKSPNYQYFPNMYVSPSYETYGAYPIFPGEQSAMMPAENSVPRGFVPYTYDDTPDGLLKAKADLKSPYEVNEKNLAVGNQLYTIYCAVCHGDKGDGKGILVQREKFLGIPSYADPGRTINPGGIYHVSTYGLNAMGSYASQTSEKERWQIAMHVMDLKASLLGEPGVLETAGKASAEEDADKIPETTGANTAGEIQNK